MLKNLNFATCGGFVYEFFQRCKKVMIAFLITAQKKMYFILEAQPEI